MYKDRQEKYNRILRHTNKEEKRERKKKQGKLKLK